MRHPARLLAFAFCLASLGLVGSPPAQAQIPVGELVSATYSMNVPKRVDNGTDKAGLIVAAVGEDGPISEGVVFKISNFPNTILYHQPVDTSSGVAKIEDLPPDNYIVEVYTAPDGYTLNGIFFATATVTSGTDVIIEFNYTKTAAFRSFCANEATPVPARDTRMNTRDVPDTRLLLVEYETGVDYHSLQIEPTQANLPEPEVISKRELPGGEVITTVGWDLSSLLSGNYDITVFGTVSGPGYVQATLSGYLGGNYISNTVQGLGPVNEPCIPGPCNPCTPTPTTPAPTTPAPTTPAPTTPAPVPTTPTSNPTTTEPTSTTPLPTNSPTGAVPTPASGEGRGHLYPASGGSSTPGDKLPQTGAPTLLALVAGFFLVAGTTVVLLTRHQRRPGRRQQ